MGRSGAAMLLVYYVIITTLLPFCQYEIPNKGWPVSHDNFHLALVAVKLLLDDDDILG